MDANRAVVYWDRREQALRTERVYGDRGLRLLYQTAPGRVCLPLLTQRWLSRVVGGFHSSRLSRGKIRRFIREFSIPMEEYESGPFDSFNQFFIRRFRQGAREFCGDPERMPAFAEGRYLAFAAVDEQTAFPVKGVDLLPSAVLGEDELAGRLAGGPLLIARLCPVDYHRFHYPDDGRTLRQSRLQGVLHSVNPMALAARSGIFRTNERRVSLLQTAHFGLLAYVEVGALCVGRIVQSHAGAEFRRGDEKGYFLFGASSILLFGERGRWLPDGDLIERTDRRLETLVRLGEPFATALPAPAGS